MSEDDNSDHQAPQYAFVVYDPPAPGLPWLSVCVDPVGRISGVEAFENPQDAEAKAAKCAQDFVQRFSDKGRMKLRIGPPALH